MKISKFVFMFRYEKYNTMMENRLVNNKHE